MLSAWWKHAICLLVFETERDRTPRVIGPFEDMDSGIEFKNKYLDKCYYVNFAPITNSESAHEYRYGDY